MTFISCVVWRVGPHVALVSAGRGEKICKTRKKSHQMKGNEKCLFILVIEAIRLLDFK